MKNTLYILIVTSLLGMTSCEYDNYDGPEALLQGALIDADGDTVKVGYQEVTFRIFDVPAYPGNAPIEAFVAQDGTYSSLLFAGDYKLIFPANSGPFMPVRQSEELGDTLLVNLGSSKSYNISVTPYYKITDASFSSSSNIVTASVDLEKVVNDENAKDIESITLYINKTTFVGQVNNARSASVNGGDLTGLTGITLQIEVPGFTPTQNYVFARIGVKLAGVEDRLYSSIQKLTVN